MKRRLHLALLLCSLPHLLPAQIGIYQQGTVVRMRMGDCLPIRNGLVAALGVQSAPAAAESCPEYTLVSKNVVFLVVGKPSGQIIPLARAIDFRLHKNELAVRVDDAKRELRFAIREMMIRSEWERLQRHIDWQMRTSEASEPEP
jgi:hypothetical protein